MRATFYNLGRTGSTEDVREHARAFPAAADLRQRRAGGDPGPGPAEHRDRAVVRPRPVAVPDESSPGEPRRAEYGRVAPEQAEVEGDVLDVHPCERAAGLRAPVAAVERPELT